MRVGNPEKRGEDPPLKAATYIWVREDPLSTFDPREFSSTEYQTGDEVPYDALRNAWDDHADSVAVLDEDGDLIESIGAARPGANPDRVDDVLDAREQAD